MFGAFKAGLATGQHELPLHRRRARLPVGQRRRRRRRVPRHVHRATASDRATACRAIRTWLWVDDGSGAVPGLGDAVRGGRRTRRRRTDASAPWGRSGDHLLLLYTGGTTGMPKGVMWRQDDLFGALDAANRKRLPPEPDLDAARRRASPSPARATCRRRR